MTRDQYGSPLRRQRPQKPSHPDDPFGIHAVERLVEDQDRRVAEHRRGEPESLAHPEREPAGLAPRHRFETGLLDHLVDAPGRQTLGMGKPQEMVAGAPARLHGARVQQRPDLTERMAQGGVRPPADQRAALVDRVEAEDHPHRCGLASAVRPDEPGHAPGRDRERQAVEGERLPEPLQDPVDFDRRFHAGKARRRTTSCHRAGEPSFLSLG